MDKAKVKAIAEWEAQQRLSSCALS
ncbi:hypothetical protein Patl1_15953 [Pistacia atlantica]|uniref:Uncharacterized protein n=1 Tax=Pistacia atlantica TaxID=434234 RepID=A0ACC1BB26_9ROSI|nr:hypothetical protein Patl1_15953 [Pistacia atlantica]